MQEEKWLRVANKRIEFHSQIVHCFHCNDCEMSETLKHFLTARTKHTMLHAPIILRDKIHYDDKRLKRHTMRKLLFISTKSASGSIEISDACIRCCVESFAMSILDNNIFDELQYSVFYLETHFASYQSSACIQMYIHSMRRTKDMYYIATKVIERVFYVCSIVLCNENGQWWE